MFLVFHVNTYAVVTAITNSEEKKKEEEPNFGVM